MEPPLVVDWDAPKPVDDSDVLSVDWPAEEAEAAPKPMASGVSKALIGVGGGALAGVGALGLRRLLRLAFPGSMPKTSQMRKLDEAIKSGDESSSLKKEFGDYMRFASTTDKPVTLADWFAAKGNPNVVEAIRSMVAHSGKGEVVKKQVEDRAFDQKGRVLESLARAMGIKQQGLPKTLEELNKARMQNATPLYAQAFADRSPLKHTDLYDFLGKNEELMQTALAHADDAFRFDPDKRISTQMVNVADPSRKDAWKWEATRTIPEYLHFGEPKAGLQKAISPNLETLDRMKRALWSLAQQRQKEGAGDVGAIHAARRELTAILDRIGPEAYGKARAQSKSDIEAEEAAEVGARLLRMKPSEVQAAMAAMGPHEREAAMLGFYGALADQNAAKVLREYVAKPDRYPEARQTLSHVFRDPTGYDQFLKELEVEHALSAGQRFGDYAAVTDMGGKLNPVAAASAPKLELARFGRDLVGWPSRRASRSGVDMLFSPAHRVGPGIGHQNWDDVRGLPTGALEILKRDVAPWTAYGATAGGLGALGYEVMDRFPPRSPDPMEMHYP